MQRSEWRNLATRDVLDSWGDRANAEPVTGSVTSGFRAGDGIRHAGLAALAVGSSRFPAVSLVKDEGPDEKRVRSLVLQSR
jgi:hypothetical protein